MITLLVPTKDRPAFITRLLGYYAATGYQHWIAIGDSSGPAHALRIQETIARFSSRPLRIVYQFYPGLNDSACLAELIRATTTPYAAFLADDDFVVPDGLEQCVAFLEQHPDYSAAHGRGMVLKLDARGPYGTPTSGRSYRQPVVEAGTASQRLLDHLAHYSVTLFSVHRTASWRAMYQDITSLTDKTFTELLPSCLSVIEGKVKEVSAFYLVRQNHDERYFLPGVYEWIANSNWQASYGVFHRRLAQALAGADRIALEQSEEVVTQAFWLYVSRHLTNAWQARYGGVRQVPAWRSWARRAIRAPGRIGRVLGVGSGRDDMSLLALAKPSSPHHAAFRAVCRAMTRPVHEVAGAAVPHVMPAARAAITIMRALSRGDR